MKFGLFSLMTVRDNPGGLPGVLRDTASMVGLAEDIGFDIAWFAEHHFSNYSISISPAMVAAWFAGRTRRIRLGTGVIVLPLYQPLRIAQEIALLDQMSEGRAVIGVGTGYQPYEFTRYGVDVARKTDIFLEYWSVLEQALVEGRVAFDGEFVQVPETALTIRPVQRPMPPVFCTSPHPPILKALARHGGVPFLTTGWRGSKALIQACEQVGDRWAEAGLDRATMPVAVQQYIHVTDSPAETREAAERARFHARLLQALRSPTPGLDGASVVGLPFDGEPTLDGYADNLIIGDVEHVVRRMTEEIRALRPVHYNAFFQFGDMPIARARRSLERFGAEVIPMLARELGPLAAIGQGG